MELGTSFGKLTTISETYLTKLNNGKNVSAVMCSCSCGNKKQVLVTNLKTGKTTSCGMCRSTTFPKVGDVVGSWKVLDIDGHYATCVCSCGNTRTIYIYSLGTDSSSCHGRKNDGRRRAKLKRIWLLMKDRCEHPDSIGWKDYGARGIRVCDEWQVFENFYIWSVSQGYIQLTGLQIDRIDYNGDYSPDNCRWTDKFTNARNKRNTKWITAFGETKSLPEWVEDDRCSVKYATLWIRLKNGFDAELAITSPSGRLPKAVEGNGGAVRI